MPYRKGDNWYNDHGERIYNPKAYFKAAGLEEEYDRAHEKYIDAAADRAEGQLVLEALRKQDLENAGYSSEEEYADDYWAGESSGDLGEPASPLDNYDEQDYDYSSGSQDDYIGGNWDEDC